MSGTTCWRWHWCKDGLTVIFLSAIEFLIWGKSRQSSHRRELQGFPSQGSRKGRLVLKKWTYLVVIFKKYSAVSQVFCCGHVAVSGDSVAGMTWQPSCCVFWITWHGRATLPPSCWTLGMVSCPTTASTTSAPTCWLPWLSSPRPLMLSTGAMLSSLSWTCLFNLHGQC